MTMPLDPIAPDLMRRVTNIISSPTIRKLWRPWRIQGTNARVAFRNAETQTTGGLEEDHLALEEPEQQGPEEHYNLTEQEKRQQRYLTFTLEEVSDYTFGPSRLVAADDGVAPCAALLMKLELSERIQKAMRIQRQVQREERHAKAQMREIDNFLLTVDDEILDYNIREVEARNDGDEEKHDKVLKAQHILRQMQERLPAERTVLENRVRHRIRELQTAQSAVISYLEDAFVSAKLIESDSEEEIPVKVFDLQEEYRKACNELDGVSEHGEHEAEGEAEGEETGPSIPFEALETGEDLVHRNMASPTPSQQAEFNLRAAYEQAKHRKEEAQIEFDRKEHLREQERMLCESQVLRGEPALYATEEEFDHKWIENFRAITHELVESGRELAEIKRFARRIGVDLEVDYDFEEQAETHSDISFEVDAEVAKSRVIRRVEPWIDSVLEGVPKPVEGGVEVDDWDAREVEVGADSASCLAVDEYHFADEIAEWQQVCQETREQIGNTGPVRQIEPWRFGPSKLQGSGKLRVVRSAP